MTFSPDLPTYPAIPVRSYPPYMRLPSSRELPDSDETPVDNELQNLIPNLLGMILARLWADRDDWLWAVDMGIYHHPYKTAFVPDGFLSLGVDRYKSVNLRRSYVVWEEKGILPMLTLEVVSETYNGEYARKKRDNARLGIPYYVVFNPLGGKPRRSGQRRLSPNQHQKLEVYRLAGTRYRRQDGNPVWLPDIGLGIGYEMGTHQGHTREWLYWYDQAGNRYPSPEEALLQAEEQAIQAEERATQAEQQLIQERQQQQALLEQLRSLSPETLSQLGIDPATLL